MSRIRNHRFILIFVLALSSFLVGCTGVRQGTSWPDVAYIPGDEGESGILVAYNDFIVLVDPANGRPVQLRNTEGEIRTDEEGNPRRWEVRGGETDSRFFNRPLLQDDGQFLVADYNNKLLNVNVSRAEVVGGSLGELPGHILANPVEADGVLYVPFSERDLGAYDMETLEEIWLFETERGVWASPILMDGIVYIPGMNHNLYAVDARTGEEIWQADLGGAIASTPLFHEGRFFVGTFNRAIFEISMDGEILSEYNTDNWVWSTPVLYDGVIYVTDLSGNVYALDIANGLAEVWMSDVSSRGIRPAPLVTDEYVIVADRGGNVYWLERATGTVIEDFTQETGSEILSEIILLEREEPFEPLVVVSTVNANRTLVAFTLDSVAQWTYDR